VLTFIDMLKKYFHPPSDDVLMEKGRNYIIDGKLSFFKFNGSMLLEECSNSIEVDGRVIQITTRSKVGDLTGKNEIIFEDEHWTAYEEKNIKYKFVNGKWARVKNLLSFQHCYNHSTIQIYVNGFLCGDMMLHLTKRTSFDINNLTSIRRIINITLVDLTFNLPELTIDVLNTASSAIGDFFVRDLLVVYVDGKQPSGFGLVEMSKAEVLLMVSTSNCVEDKGFISRFYSNPTFKSQ